MYEILTVISLCVFLIDKYLVVCDVVHIHWVTTLGGNLAFSKCDLSSLTLLLGLHCNRKFWIMIVLDELFIGIGNCICFCSLMVCRF